MITESRPADHWAEVERYLSDAMREDARRGNGSSGVIRRALNLAGMPAFNEYRPFGGERQAREAGVGVGEYDYLWARNRNAAKRVRKARRR